MVEISVLLNGDGVQEEEFLNLEKKLDHVNRDDHSIEFILYFSSKPTFSSSANNLSIVYSKSKTLPLQKAFASATGNKYIVTTIRNILFDESNKMINQTYKSQVLAFGLPFKNNILDKLIGIRRLRNIPYIIVTKRFATNHIGSITNVKELAKCADRELLLERLERPSIILPNFIIKRAVLYRPYRAMLRNQFLKIKEKRKAKKAERLRRQVKPVHYSENLPVFIICRDRLTPLKRLVKWCEDEGLKNIIFIDNASSYPPLIDYYASTKYEVVRLNTNIGQTSPWDSGIVKIYAKDKPYIVSDFDIIPEPGSHGAIKFFTRLLNDYPERTKVGFGLRIDNLPDSYELKEYVIAWEKLFWQTQVEDNVYDAEIDTTFALYRQNTPYVLGPGLRTGGKYIASHEPWYIDSNKVDDEIRYYRSHSDKKIGSWGIDASDISQTYVDHSHKTSLPRS